MGYDGQVHLAEVRTGEELLVLRSAARPSDNAGFTPRLTFSRDGSRLAANGVSDVSFWEISTPTGPMILLWCLRMSRAGSDRAGHWPIGATPRRRGRLRARRGARRL